MATQTLSNMAPALRFPYGKRRKLGDKAPVSGESPIPQVPKGMGNPMMKLMGKGKKMTMMKRGA
jgi:hypothetical protein